VRPAADIERDLARLADGTLPADRARELEARVQESPELRELLDQQRRAIGLVATLSDPASAALRARVEQLRRRPEPAMRMRRFGFAGGLAAAAAAVAIALVAILPSGGGSLSLADASAFALKAPLAPPPAHTSDGTLNLKIDGVPFPYWKDKLGWKAAGMRRDKISGRTIITVFYAKGSSRVGYTIVSGKPVSVSGSPSVVHRNGIRFRSLPLHNATVVTWERRDHSCILAGRGITRAQLVQLASWKDSGELPWPGKNG
jgi:hypothetical protein